MSEQIKIQEIFLDAKKKQSSLEAYNLSLAVKQKASEVNNKALKAEVSLFLADILLENGVFDQALEQAFEALQYFSKSDNRAKHETCLRTLAITFGKLENHEKRLEYSLKCLELLKAFDNPKEVIRIKNNIAYSYMMLSRYNEAIAIFNENYYHPQACSNIVCASLKNIGECYLLQKEFERSEQYFEQGLKIAIKHQFADMEAAFYFFFGELFFHKKEFDKAYDFTLTASQILTDKYQYLTEIQRILNLQIKIEIELNLKDKLKETFKEYKHISNMREQQILGNSNKAIKFKLEIDEIKKERNILKEQNDLLKQANTKIEQQSIALEEKTKQLLKVNNDLEAFAHVIAHDIKQPIRTIRSFIQLFERDLNTSLNEKANTHLSYIKKGAIDLSDLVNDVLQYSIAGAITEELVSVNVNQVIDKIRKNLEFHLSECNGQIIAEDLPTIIAHKTPVIQIFQNIISNAIKFRKKNVAPIINISAHKNEAYTVFEISDNGIGIEKKNIDKIFDLFTRLNSKSAYEGTGIGLATVVKLLKQYKAKIEVSSEKGIGTTFKILFPE